MFFANEQRENVHKENPGISFGKCSIAGPSPSLNDHVANAFPVGQVGKVLGERWKALNEKQRGPYEAKAAQDKKRYEDEKASYNVSLSSTSTGPFLRLLTRFQAAAEDEESS
jgi:hypothetical protein